MRTKSFSNRSSAPAGMNDCNTERSRENETLFKPTDRFETGVTSPLRWIWPTRAWPRDYQCRTDTSARRPSTARTCDRTWRKRREYYQALQKRKVTVLKHTLWAWLPMSLRRVDSQTDDLLHLQSSVRSSVFVTFIVAKIPVIQHTPPPTELWRTRTDRIKSN